MWHVRWTVYIYLSVVMILFMQCGKQHLRSVQISLLSFNGLGSVVIHPITGASPPFMASSGFQKTLCTFCNVVADLAGQLGDFNRTPLGLNKTVLLGTCPRWKQRATFYVLLQKNNSLFAKHSSRGPCKMEVTNPTEHAEMSWQVRPRQCFRLQENKLW